MAILQPEEMDFSGKKFSMIISGPPGVGKTTLALSAPNPVLIDFDKGVSRVKAVHRKATIVCSTYEEVQHDIETEAVRTADTIIIDTGGSFVTYLQDWAMRTNPAANRQKSGALSQKGFGAVKAEFVSFTNKLLYTMDKNVIYIFHTVEERDRDVVKHRLLCEGSARNIVWQPCDLGCFLQIIGGERVLGFSPTEEYFAKGCYGIHDLQRLPELDDSTPNNYLTRLFEKARENIRREAQESAGPRAAYEEAMERGCALVAGTVDGASATSALTAIRALTHSLTSERELRSLFSTRVKELGLVWNEERKCYEG